ncbi:AGE family epimerase/isomerase [Paenibacillus sp. J2TS4]|uniref:AGE family epimerase/isomerase n=1 Tax=Paenibacillus sp. J2TS4 TaxID=2807194 RepID=UPI001B1C4E4B|nr:AGE family epimerase/isomerase [Paenibacillus sp. J2TS4]GIP34621.1 N-acylglucosamine 2-epimerase [Paenibacillus sp. J2TS4]
MIMESLDRQALLDFYTDHLQNTLLPFWLRSVDWEDGGYYNCYDNTGEVLVSEDKYTWSQGRFVWMYAKLASTTADIFNEEERKQFLNLARHGAEFLKKHCLLDNGHCTFVMDKQGNPKVNTPGDSYDSSIFADCFVIAGLAKYAAEAGDNETLAFARKLYDSVTDRIDRNEYYMAPYPTPKGYKSHNIPMILLNVTQELWEASVSLKDTDTDRLAANMKRDMDEITLHFRDDSGVLNEKILADNRREDTLLGRYCNPGHVIEDMWFLIHAAQKLNLESYIPQAIQTTRKMVELGWDSEHGGLLLFIDRCGGPPVGEAPAGLENEPMVKQIRDNWANKLWWPHSEALYTTLLCYRLSGDEQFVCDYKKIHDYTFSTFPNPNKEVGEWIQIRKQNGEPIDKVVALPVKDPYHIIRNVIYIIELLHDMEASK